MNEREESYALEESLHGREILGVQALRLLNGRDLIITGSEDTYIKVSEFDEGTLKPVQTFSNHVASVRVMCKLKLLQPENSKTRQHLIISAGSRL